MGSRGLMGIDEDWRSLGKLGVRWSLGPGGLWELEGVENKTRA